MGMETVNKLREQLASLEALAAEGEEGAGTWFALECKCLAKEAIQELDRLCKLLERPIHKMNDDDGDVYVPGDDEEPPFSPNDQPA